MWPKNVSNNFGKEVTISYISNLWAKFILKICSFLLSAPFNLSKHPSLRRPRDFFFSFPNTSFIFLLCLFHYVYVNMLPKQPLHSVNSVKKRNQSSLLLGSLETKRAADGLDVSPISGLFWRYLGAAFVSFFSPFIGTTLIAFVLAFLGILLASSFHFWLFKQLYLQTRSSIDLFDICSKWFSTKYRGYLSW